MMYRSIALVVCALALTVGLTSIAAAAQSPPHSFEEALRLQRETMRLMALGRLDEAEVAARQADALQGGSTYADMVVAARQGIAIRDEIPPPPPLFVELVPFFAFADESHDGLSAFGPEVAKLLVSAGAAHRQGVAAHEAGDVVTAIGAYEATDAAMRKAAAQAGHLAVAVQISRPFVLANLGLAYWQNGAPQKAVTAFRAALEARAVFDGTLSDPYTTERAALAVAQSRAIETHPLVTLEREVGAAAGLIGLEALLERKGAVLSRQARVLASYRREIHGQRGAIEQLFPWSRQAEYQQEQRAAGRELLAELDAVTAERAGLAALPPAAPDEQVARNRRIAELDARIATMQSAMATQTSARTELATPSLFSVFRDILGPVGANEGTKADMARAEKARQQSARAARAQLISDVQRSVPTGAVLIEMVRYQPFDPRVGLLVEQRFGPARYGAYVVTQSGPPQYVELGDAQAIESLIEAFRRALAQPGNQGASELGRRLDELLMQPMRALIGNARTLYIAPEGALNLVPLAALVDEQGRYLVERYTFSYLASGRDLLLLGRGEAPRGPPVIIADPAFAAEAGSSRTTGTRALDFGSMSFSPLPGTAAEAQTLAKLLPSAFVLTGAQATETAAKRVSGPRMLHIATHGFFLEDAPVPIAAIAGDPRGAPPASAAAPQQTASRAQVVPLQDPMLRSGLVFAGVNALRSGDDDGVLTALEAASLDLRGTKLVVLSACETGVGDVRNGEGVFGLRRAFVVAGAETLVMSLWKVDDDATNNLMTQYYKRLTAGAARAEALRQAQLELLKNAKTGMPFYWASFILSGEPGPM